MHEILHFSADYKVVGLWAFALNFSLVGIVIGYHIIAYQFWKVRRPSFSQHMKDVDHAILQRRARLAFLQLLFIFVGCSWAGYLPRLFDFPIELFVAIHVALFAATWWYILSRQAVIIAVAMSSNDRI